jgi:hypothetical protein
MTITSTIAEVRISRRRYQVDRTVALELRYEDGSGDTVPVAFADTPVEAEQAKRAFENVLAPRFTRDEAIAIVLDSPIVARVQRHPHDAPFYAGMRAALEALAAAGVFSDSDAFAEKYRTPTMADLLDAAGIR